jgi:membrane protease YdiL (CAAX protease family)
MKRCGYCGRENEDEAALCVECGTSLMPEPDALPQSGEEVATPSAGRSLRAGAATIILVVYLGAQFFAGAVTAITVGALAASEGKNLQDPRQLAETKQAMMAPAVVLSFVVSGAAMALTSVLMFRNQLRDTSPVGAAWAIGPVKGLAQGFGIGLILALCGLAFLGGPQRSMGPVTKMAVTPGLPQMLWLMALLIAAPIEEPLFRGVLYGGYRKSFGPVAAALLTTLIFVLLHITEIIHSVPAAVAITALGLTALWLRLRSAAIGPPIAAHFGYNIGVGLMTIVSTSMR